MIYVRRKDVESVTRSICSEIDGKEKRGVEFDGLKNI